LDVDFEIKNLTSFKIGGKIARMYFPVSLEEFIEIIKNEPDALIVGNLSNTLVSSFGYNGAVISTSKMNEISINNTTVIAGAGVKGPKLSQTAAENCLSGLEFMIGFPGSVGGEVYMNASANGQSVADVLKSVKVYCPEKGIITIPKSDMGFDYRTSVCQNKPYIILEAEFELVKKDKEEINSQMQKNLDFRKKHQPSLKLPNCGSIFKNPNGNSAGRLLDSIGAKQLAFGGVRVWDNHANFIVNDRAGSSLDVLELMFQMYTKVKEKYNIELEPEIRFLGGNNEKEVEICRKLKML